jgi:hypothetical protein
VAAVGCSAPARRAGDAGRPRRRAHPGALRSAKNTDRRKPARCWSKTFNDRFHGQSERVADTVRNAIPGGEVNATKTADQLVAEYDAGRVPAYKQAYQQGDRPLMSPAMERLMGTDTFVAAMKKAISSGKDRDAVMGFGGFNPMVNVTEDGRIVFNKGAQGIPTYPNLQYWDQVKRELDAVANMAKRSGDNERADLSAAAWRRSCAPNSIVRCRAIPTRAASPSSISARATRWRLAASWLARKSPGAGAKHSAQMKPDERALFQEGYASDLARARDRQHEGHHQYHQG